jgi:hypothetical protein
MAYSSSFLDIRNNNERQVEILDADNFSRYYSDLENNLKFEEREINQHITKPSQITNENETPLARKRKKEPTRLITEEEHKKQIDS